MKEAQGVLLTGATGAIGPELAVELLAADAGRELYVLVREGADGGGAAATTKRFNSWLNSLAVLVAQRPFETPRWRERVRLVAGNLRRDAFGLSVEQSNELAARTNIIVHAAADTQFLSSLEDQWGTNVDGTRRILHFAHRCPNLQKVLLVSTVCTSGTRIGPITETFVDSHPRFVNNYERTKWEAERIALSSDLPLAIARVAIVLGSHASGAVHRPGALHHLIKWFSRGLVPVIPGTDQTLVDLISSELVACFIAKAVECSWNRGAIWHVAAGQKAARLSELSRVVWSQAFPGEPEQSGDDPDQPFIVSQHVFDRVRLSKAHPRDRVVRQAMDSINSFLPMLLYPRCYDTTSAEHLWGGPLPWPDWRETLVGVMNSLGINPTAGARHRSTRSAAMRRAG
jgi:nucleoside-diphosphate-sugar epimerase